MADPIPPVLTSIAGAVSYSLVAYGSKAADEQGETFDQRKFARTVFIGILVGLYAYATGLELSPASVEHVAFTTGIVVLADQLTKLLYRAVQRYRAGKKPLSTQEG